MASAPARNFFQSTIHFFLVTHREAAPKTPQRSKMTTRPGSVLATTSAVLALVVVASALSLPQTRRHRPNALVCRGNRSRPIATALRLGPLDDTDPVGERRQSELDSLTSKRDQIRAAKLANLKPADETPRVKEMSDEEIQAMFAMKER